MVFGLQGSGKSNWTKAFLLQHPQHLVYDTMREYQDFNTYTPHFPDGSPESCEELSSFIEAFVTSETPGAKKLKVLAIDEINTYCPNRVPLPRGMVGLNDKSRHFDISFLGIARRPAQVNTDLVELAHYIVIFNLKGVNDEAYFEQIRRGLGETVTKLPPFHYALVDQNREVTICKPCKNMDPGGKEAPTQESPNLVQEPEATPEPKEPHES